MLELNRLYHMDCLEGMRQFPDKYFELAVVDPPYGGGAQQAEDAFNGAIVGRFGGRFGKYFPQEITRTGGTRSVKCQNGNNAINHWDIAPTQAYFDELFRVSQNQIIWGGNYFALPPTRCFLVWRKLTISESFSMAMCEYAWTSFNDNAKWIEKAPQGTSKEARIHPTQKPIALYKWVYAKYAREGDKILDTHAGSASSFVAAYEMGFAYIGFEIDAEYHRLATKRMEKTMAQGRLFNQKPNEGMEGGNRVLCTALSGVGAQQSGQTLHADFDISQGVSKC